MSLRYSQAALRQIATILAEIERHSPQGASNVQQRLEDAASVLLEHPEAGH